MILLGGIYLGICFKVNKVIQGRGNNDFYLYDYVSIYIILKVIFGIKIILQGNYVILIIIC